MAIAQLTSRIDKVKVYAAGATVTRVAQFQINAGEVPEHVEIAGLPLALDDSSVRVRLEAFGDTAIATDIRIGLTVPPPQEVENSPTDEEIREARAKVRQIEDVVTLIENEISILQQIEIPERPEGEQGKAPPASPISARLALANFKDEQIRAKIQERRENLQKLRIAKEHLEDLLQKQTHASSAKEVKAHELRKTVVVRLSYQGEVITVTEQQLIVEYFVPGARWTPTYVCRLDSIKNQAVIAVRALICQLTGEDWSGVGLELSTALPMTWCELPELASLRLGRAQPVVKKSGWRRAPIGAEILFEDFDRQQEVSLSAVGQDSLISEISSSQVPLLQNLVIRTRKRIAETLEVNKEEIDRWKQSLTDQLKAIRFDLLTPKAINAILLAQEEARRLGNNIDTEQILLGLIGEDTGLAARILKSSGVNLKDVRIEVEKIIGRGSGFSVWDSKEQYKPTKKAVYKSSALAELTLEWTGMTDDEDSYGSIPIEELQLSVRAYNSLKRAQINSISDLLNYSQEDLLEITKLNQKNVQEVAEALQKRFGTTLPSQENALKMRRRPAIFGENRIEKKDPLAYSLMRMGAANEPAKRGKLFIEEQQEAYLEILKRQQIIVTFNVMQVVKKAVLTSQDCIFNNLPPGGINVREVAGSFDYAYNADGRIDVPSDGEFHSIALTSNSTEVDVGYVVVPREDTNVFRIAQLQNPLQAPLLSGPADVYVDGEYILSTNISTVPAKGQMELGLGVEQAIKVARNTTYQEVRSGQTLVAFNELRHQIKIDITNHLPREAKIEVRERLPIPQEDAKVDVQIAQVSPNWEKYEQEERKSLIKGGYRWRVIVPAREQTNLSVDYTIKTFVDSELIGGNRREA